MSAQHRRQPPGQRRENGPIGPVRLWPSDLTPQHRHLMTQHHDLCVLRRLAAAQQRQPAEHPKHDQIEQANRHKTRSFLRVRTPSNHRSEPSWLRCDAVQGDRVRTQDPKSGATISNSVLAVITGTGGKNLVEVTAQTGGLTGTVVATADHPFWSEDLRGWTAATHLWAGAWLRTDDGDRAHVLAPAKRTVNVYNLTVANNPHVLRRDRRQGRACPQRRPPSRVSPRHGVRRSPFPQTGRRSGMRSSACSPLCSSSSRWTAAESVMSNRQGWSARPPATSASASGSWA